jgi:hypothetical protein
MVISNINWRMMMKSLLRTKLVELMFSGKAMLYLQLSLGLIVFISAFPIAEAVAAGPLPGGHGG